MLKTSNPDNCASPLAFQSRVDGPGSWYEFRQYDDFHIFHMPKDLDTRVFLIRHLTRMS